MRISTGLGTSSGHPPHYWHDITGELGHMTQEYINWAFQQVVEPLPGVKMTIGTMAAPLFQEEMGIFNRRLASLLPTTWRYSVDNLLGLLEVAQL